MGSGGEDGTRAGPAPGQMRGHRRDRDGGWAGAGGFYLSGGDLVQVSIVVRSVVSQRWLMSPYIPKVV
jgi:hypothetical protein